MHNIDYTRTMCDRLSSWKNNCTRTIQDRYVVCVTVLGWWYVLLYCVGGLGWWYVLLYCVGGLGWWYVLLYSIAWWRRCR